MKIYTISTLICLFGLNSFFHANNTIHEFALLCILRQIGHCVKWDVTIGLELLTPGQWPRYAKRSLQIGLVLHILANEGHLFFINQ